VSHAGGDFGDVLKRAEALVPVWRERAAHTDALRALPAETVADIKDSGVARIFQPARFGGCEAPLEAMVHVLSTLARGCASSAWVTAQHASHNLLIALWPEAAQRRIWEGDPAVLVSGSLAAASGWGRRVPGGYMIGGRWPWASGVTTCDWGIVAASTDEGQNRVGIRHYLLPRAEFEIVDVWHAMGLRGTASNDIAIAEAFVPEAMTLSIEQMKGGDSPGTALNAAPLYRTPAYMMFGVIQGSVCVGIAEAALERYLTHARGRVALMSSQRVTDYPTQQAKVAEAAATLAAAKASLLSICREVTDLIAGGALPSAEQRAMCRTHAALAGRMAAQTVNALWDAGGGAGVLDANPMSRLFRDMSAAQRHFSMNWDVNAITTGRLLLGLPSDSAVL
jgi:alkylation response protein AidB-like acyl-CoA dehydrogenase